MLPLMAAKSTLHLLFGGRKAEGFTQAETSRKRVPLAQDSSPASLTTWPGPHGMLPVPRQAPTVSKCLNVRKLLVLHRRFRFSCLGRLSMDHIITFVVWLASQLRDQSGDGSALQPPPAFFAKCSQNALCFLQSEAETTHFSAN